MSTSPLFSVVTVTLNCREEALRTARTVWQQEAADYQYLVKDGGSKDGTLETICQAGQADIQVLPDRGIFDAMSQAINFCRGHYILFLNAGDSLLGKDALATVGAFARQQEFPEVIYTYNYNELLKTEFRYPAHLSHFFLFRRAVCHQATYIRRDSFRDFGGFDPALTIGADDELLVRLVCRHHVRARLCPIVSVTFKDGGFSATPKSAQLKRAAWRCIRQRHFSKRERLLFGSALGLTLYPLRQWLLQRNRTGWYARLYRCLANRGVGAGLQGQEPPPRPHVCASEK
jgi:GT2 family glycosyltransferase